MRFEISWFVYFCESDDMNYFLSIGFGVHDEIYANWEDCCESVGMNMRDRDMYTKIEKNIGCGWAFVF